MCSHSHWNVINNHGYHNYIEKVHNIEYIIGSYDRHEHIHVSTLSAHVVSFLSPLKQNYNKRNHQSKLGGNILINNNIRG